MDTDANRGGTIEAAFVSMLPSGQSSIRAAQNWIRYGLNANSFAVDERRDPSYECPANQLAYEEFGSCITDRRPFSDTMADQAAATSRILALWNDKYPGYEFDASLRTGSEWIGQTAVDPADSTRLRIALPPLFKCTGLAVSVTAERLTFNPVAEGDQRVQLLNVEWDSNQVENKLEEGVVTIPIDLISRGVQFKKLGTVIGVEEEMNEQIGDETEMEEMKEMDEEVTGSETEEGDSTQAQRAPKPVTFKEPVPEGNEQNPRFTPWFRSLEDCYVYGRVEAAKQTDGRKWRLRKLADGERVGNTYCTIGMCEVGIFNAASRNLFKTPPDVSVSTIQDLFETKLKRNVRESYSRSYSAIDESNDLFDVEWAFNQATTRGVRHTLQTLASSVLRDLVRRRCMATGFAEGRQVELGVDAQLDDDTDVKEDDESTVLNVLVKEWGAALTTQHYIRFKEDNSDPYSAEWIAESVAADDAQPRAPDVMAAAAFSSCAYPYTNSPEDAPSPSNANWFGVRVVIRAQTNDESRDNISYDRLFPGRFTYKDMNDELEVYDRLAPPPRSLLDPIRGTPLATRDIATSTLPATWEAWTDIPAFDTTEREVKDAVFKQEEVFRTLDDGGLCACIAPIPLELEGTNQPLSPCALCLEYEDGDRSSSSADESIRAQYAKTNDAIRRLEILLLERMDMERDVTATAEEVVRSSDVEFIDAYKTAAATLINIMRELDRSTESGEALKRLKAYTGMIAFEVSASIDNDDNWRATTGADEIVAPLDVDEFEMEKLLLRSMLYKAYLLDDAEDEDDERGWSKQERQQLDQLVGEVPDPFLFLVGMNTSNKRGRDDGDDNDDNDDDSSEDSGPEKKIRRSDTSIEAPFERAIAECLEISVW